jgi:hypothetical protein
MNSIQRYLAPVLTSVLRLCNNLERSKYGSLSSELLERQPERELGTQRTAQM